MSFNLKCTECLHTHDHAKTCSQHPERIMFREYHEKLIAAFEQLPNYDLTGRAHKREDFLRVLSEVKP